MLTEATPEPSHDDEVRCQNEACDRYFETFEWTYHASFNETVEGREMSDEETRNTAWAVCPECGTARYFEGQTQVRGW